MRKSKTTTGSAGVSLGVIEGANLQLTTQNTLFVTFNGRTSFPYLTGGAVRFDEEHFEVPKAAHEKIRAILLKQAEVRKAHAEDFDDEDLNRAFTYS